MKVTSFRELMREQAKAAVRISGAHHSSWNERLRPLPRDGRSGGVAAWDHAIAYNPEFVDEPLQQMFANARVHNQDPADLRRYRDALRIVLHENVHMLASQGREHGQAKAAFESTPGVRAMEESISEIYSQQRLDDYIDEMGLDEIAPGIKDVRTNPVYKQWLPAAEAFAKTLGNETGLGRDEIVQRLAVVPADQKFTVAAEAIYDNSDLPGIVPSDQRAQAVHRIAESMRKPFSQIEGMPESAPGWQRRLVGSEAVRQGYLAVDDLKKQWQMPAPGQQIERGVQQGPQSPAAELPADLATAVHASRSGSEPLSSASRLDENRMGSRRSGTPAGPERTPEIQR
ncbi:hypothetical protein ACI2LF_06625 [Kribbella sp. NPDC020789]